jgi:hypothetical protein
MAETFFKIKTNKMQGYRKHREIRVSNKQKPLKSLNYIQTAEKQRKSKNSEIC